MVQMEADIWQEGALLYLKAQAGEPKVARSRRIQANDSKYRRKAKGRASIRG